MEILSENGFDSFKVLMRENKKLALLGLKTGMVTPSRKILVKTEKWRCIINENFCYTINNKIYLKRVKSEELIIGKEKIYLKVNNKLNTLTPFNKNYGTEIINEIELYDYYKLDFLFPYKNYITSNTTVNFIRKNKITNFEKYFKLKFKGVPYRFFIERINGINSIEYLNNLNFILINSKNPNIIFNLNDDEISKLCDDGIIADLIQMFKIFDKKINLCWSKNRIKLEHDKCMLEIQSIKKHFITDKKYNIGKQFINILPETYELIDNDMRLFEEGENLKHCVFTSPTYKNKIEWGQSMIYSKMFNKKRYTLELEFNNFNKTYSIGQFRGFKNESAPKSLMNSLNKHLIEINSKKIKY